MRAAGGPFLNSLIPTRRRASASTVQAPLRQLWWAVVCDAILVRGEILPGKAPLAVVQPLGLARRLALLTASRHRALQDITQSGADGRFRPLKDFFSEWGRTYAQGILFGPKTTQPSATRRERRVEPLTEH